MSSLNILTENTKWLLVINWRQYNINGILNSGHDTLDSYFMTVRYSLATALPTIWIVCGAAFHSLATYHSFLIGRTFHCFVKQNFENFHGNDLLMTFIWFTLGLKFPYPLSKSLLYLKSGAVTTSIMVLFMGKVCINKIWYIYRR